VARIVRQCQDLPGQDLFQYVDADGEVRGVTSDDVNEYLREIAGAEVTAKDFRTWAGTVLAALALQEAERFNTRPAAKRNIRAAIEAVAARLGNTPTICRKCYVHPEILDCYLDEALVLEIEAEAEAESDSGTLRPDEAAVLALLRQRPQAHGEGGGVGRPAGRTDGAAASFLTAPPPCLLSGRWRCPRGRDRTHAGRTARAGARARRSTGAGPPLVQVTRASGASAPPPKRFGAWPGRPSRTVRQRAVARPLLRSAGPGRAGHGRRSGRISSAIQRSSVSALSLWPWNASNAKRAAAATARNRTPTTGRPPGGRRGPASTAKASAPANPTAPPTRTSGTEW
jgi:DNA topoisomerase-1